MAVYWFGLIDLAEEGRAVVREIWARHDLPSDEAAESLLKEQGYPAYLCPSTTNLTIDYRGEEG